MVFVRLQLTLTLGLFNLGTVQQLHGGGGPKVGKVTRLGGVTRLSI